MKRSRPPIRRTPISRAPLTTGRRRKLRPVGDTKRKKRARYAAYLKSPEWKAKRKACLEAANYRCRAWFHVDRDILPHLLPVKEGWSSRCGRKATQAHHLTYARFGNELPEDLLALCKRCHDTIEALYYPHRQRRSA